MYLNQTKNDIFPWFLLLLQFYIFSNTSSAQYFKVLTARYHLHERLAISMGNTSSTFSLLAKSSWQTRWCSKAFLPENSAMYLIMK